MGYEALILRNIKCYCTFGTKYHQMEKRSGEHGAPCVMVYLSFLLSSYSETEESTLRILRVSVEDSGVYTCVATNVAGSVTSSASLTVSGKSPVII